MLKLLNTFLTTVICWLTALFENIHKVKTLYMPRSIASNQLLVGNELFTAVPQKHAIVSMYCLWNVLLFPLTKYNRKCSFSSNQQLLKKRRKLTPKPYS